MSHMPGWYQTSNALQSTAIGEFAMYRALDKFDALLRRLARTSTVFSEVAEVYLDSCIEIKSIPRNGFMTYYKETRGECNESISTSLFGTSSNHHVAAYEFTGEQDVHTVDASVTQP